MSKSNSYFPPPRWKSPKTLWVPPEHPDIALVKITDPDDLVTWAKHMGHSGGRYQKWVIDTPIWHFLTFLDAEGFPHCTIHAKDREWWGKPHPDDAQATDGSWYWDTTGPVDKAGRSRFWVPSTLYEGRDKVYTETCLIDGVEVVIMATGHRDNDGLWPKEKALVDLWYETVRLGDA